MCGLWGRKGNKEKGMKDAMCTNDFEEDLFDSLIGAEAKSRSTGFSEGVSLGKVKNKDIGFEEGQAKGREIGSEVGFYAAWAIIWKSLDDSIEKKADKLLECALAFPTHNSSELNTELDRLRCRFKLLDSSIKKKPYYVDYNPGVDSSSSHMSW